MSEETRETEETEVVCKTVVWFDAKIPLWVARTIWISAIALGLPLLCWMLFLNHVGINHVGVAYNAWDGKVWVQDQPGWYVTSPMTFVRDITTLPFEVHIPSEARVINRKIVRFKVEGVEAFIKMQGFDYIGGSSQFQNVMMGYAFSGKDFPFLEIAQEGGPETVIQPNVEWPRVSGAQKPTGGANEKTPRQD